MSLFRNLGSKTVNLVKCLQPRNITVVAGYTTASQAANRQARIELATAYRALDKLGLNESINNHLSYMAPALNSDQHDGDVMLIIPFGLDWGEVTASSLIGVRLNGEVVEGTGKPELTAATIHGGIHERRSDATCVFHTHMPYTTALTSLKNQKVEMINQNSLKFYKRIAYDYDYTGFSECNTEGNRLADCLGKDSTVLMMANHGVTVIGKTVASAFDRLYFLERACMNQVLALSTGRELNIVNPSLCEKVLQSWEACEEEADIFFKAKQRLLLKEDSTVAD